MKKKEIIQASLKEYEAEFLIYVQKEQKLLIV